MKNDKTKTWQIAFFACNEASTTMFTLFVSFHMFFCQNVLGLSTVIIGFVLTAMRIWDGMTDPIAGYIIDKLDTRFGRYRIFVVIAIFVEVACLLAIFNMPASLGTTAKYILQTLLYTLYVAAYTMQNIIDQAFQSILTNDARKRALYPFFSGTYLAFVQALVPVLITSLLPGFFDGGMLNPKMWSAASIIVCVMGLILTALALLGMSERDKPQYYKSLPAAEKISFKTFGRVLRKGNPLRVLIVVVCLDLFAIGVVANSRTYLFSYVILDSQLQAIYSLVEGMLLLVMTGIGSLIARKCGNSKMLLFVLATAFICEVACSVLRLKYLWLFIVFYALANGCMAFVSIIGITMVGDCSDWYRSETGQQASGIIGTVYTFTFKFVSAFALSLVGTVIGKYSGENAVLVPNVFVSEAFSGAIMGLSNILPAILLFFAIVALRGYKLDKKKMEEVHQKLIVQLHTGKI